MNVQNYFGPLTLLGFFALFFAVTVPLLYVVNVNIIGPSFDRKAAALFAHVCRIERVLYEEDDLAMILQSRALSAVGVRYERANLRITDRALYVVQQGRFLGARMGQPILAIALGPMGLDPEIVPLVFIMHVAGQPQLDGRAIRMPLISKGQTHTLVLEPKGAEFALLALERVMYGR